MSLPIKTSQWQSQSKFPKPQLFKTVLYTKRLGFSFIHSYLFLCTLYIFDNKKEVGQEKLELTIQINQILHKKPIIVYTLQEEENFVKNKLTHFSANIVCVGLN